MRDIVKEAIFLREDYQRLSKIWLEFIRKQEEMGEDEELSEEEAAAEEAVDRQIDEYLDRIEEIGKQLTPEEMTDLILRHGFELVLFPTVSPGEPLDWSNSLEVRFDGLYRSDFKREHWTPEQLAWMIRKLHASSMVKRFGINYSWKTQILTGSDNGLGDAYVGPPWNWREKLRIISNDDVVLPDE